MPVQIRELTGSLRSELYLTDVREALLWKKKSYLDICRGRPSMMKTWIRAGTRSSSTPTKPGRPMSSS